MGTFRITRELTPAHFKECAVWSEYYDFEELEELLTWGVEKKYIDELLAIAKEGGAHPYYTVRNLELLPDRMRIYIYTQFITASGLKLEGIICNPNPFVIGIFVGEEIERFNPNLMDFWKESEAKVRSVYSIEDNKIFPLQYSTDFKDSHGTKIQGLYKGAMDA